MRGIFYYSTDHNHPRDNAYHRFPCGVAFPEICCTALDSKSKVTMTRRLRCVNNPALPSCFHRPSTSLFSRLLARHFHACEWLLATSPAASAPSYYIFANLSTLHFRYFFIVFAFLSLFLFDSLFHYGYGIFPSSFPSSIDASSLRICRRPLAFVFSDVCNLKSGHRVPVQQEPCHGSGS